jgi:DNA-binding FrmR family transcriptional regulator
MIDDDRYCVEVLTQISSITAALDAVALGLVDEHLRDCVMDAARENGDERDRKLDEAHLRVETNADKHYAAGMKVIVEAS